MSIPLETSEKDGVIRQVVLEKDGSISERINWREVIETGPGVLEISGARYEVGPGVCSIERDITQPIVERPSFQLAVTSQVNPNNVK